MPRYYHTTDAADAILTEGFRDGEGGYMLVGLTLRGVFVADAPVYCDEGAKGGQVLEIELEAPLPEEVELIEDMKTYREWCAPADVLNRGSVRLLTDEEADAIAPSPRREIG